MADCLFPWSELAGVTHGRWLVAPDSGGGVTNIGMNTRTIGPGQAFLAYRGDRHDSHDYLADAIANGAAALIVSRQPTDDLLRQAREHRVTCLLVDDTLNAYQSLAHAQRMRFPQLRCIVITGSCGKTSTKEMIAAIARAAVGDDAVLATEGNTNNLVGVPRNLLRLRDHHRIAVLECGTSLPGEIAILTRLCHPDIAVLTSVGPVHLEGLGSIDGVRREKAAIFQPLPMTGGWAILPADLAEHPLIQRELPQGRVITVGSDGRGDLRVTSRGGDLHGSRFSAVLPGHKPMEIAWPLHGSHQARNGGLALAVGMRLGLAPQSCADAFQHLRLPRMRMEISQRDGVSWINDAYNANAASVRALIDWLAEAAPPERPLILCLGDMLELGTYSADQHLQTLRYARDTLPHACLLPIGPEFSRAARTLSIEPAFATAADAIPWLHARLSTTTIVALKGSRGMHLESLL